MRPRALLLAAIALVCATNIGALAHAALNRRGAPDAELTLTERELAVVPAGSDTTATSLRIQWAQPPEYGRTDWMTCDRLEPLGFSCDATAGRQAERSAFVVLEYDGPAWETYRERMIAQRARAARQYRGNPTHDPAALVEGHSRLVAVDVGVDADALRAKYPDRRRYLITKGRLSVYVTAPRSERGTPVLTIAAITPGTINVPRPYAARFAPLRTRSWAPHQGPPRYTVTLRYGRFHEPWIVDISIRQ